ncbi:hypothetical protein H5410_006097 [Solanum commersonii]|uniref:Uncharacterized protein n=1 Tax=Solanum commersonii TaxID=4109 RepID=A0A9J6AA95_SOLCO|nr:hypothetical protein H5410_006097 [Solanum commersonii]
MDLSLHIVWIDHGESDGLDGIFYNSMLLMYIIWLHHMAKLGLNKLELNMMVEHDRVHEMINDAFGFKVGWNRTGNNILMKLLMKKQDAFYDQLEEDAVVPYTM